MPVTTAMPGTNSDQPGLTRNSADGKRGSTCHSLGDLRCYLSVQRLAVLRLSPDD